MFDYNNKRVGEVSRPAKQTGGGVAPSIKAANETQRIHWNDALDDKSNERLAGWDALTAPEYSWGDSLYAGIGNSVLVAALRKASEPDFDSESWFDINKTVNTDTEALQMGLTKEELSYLATSSSHAEYEFRKGRIKGQRQRDVEMSSNIVAGIAGSILGDAPLFVPQMLGTQASKLALAVRSVARGAELGTTFYASRELGQSPELIGLVASLIGADQLWDVGKTRKAIAAKKAAEESKREAARLAARQAFEDKANKAASIMSDGKKGAFADDVADATKPKKKTRAKKKAEEPAPEEAPLKPEEDTNTPEGLSKKIEEVLEDSENPKAAKARKRAKKKAAVEAAAKEAEDAAAVAETAGKAGDGEIDKPINEVVEETPKGKGKKKKGKKKEEEVAKVETEEERAQREWEEAEAEEARKEAELNGWDDLDDVPTDEDYAELYDEYGYFDETYEDAAEVATRPSAKEKPAGRMVDRMDKEVIHNRDGSVTERDIVIIDRTPDGVDVTSPTYTRELDASGIEIIDDASYNSLLDEEFDKPITATVDGKFRVEVNRETFVRITRDRIEFEVGRGWMSRELGDMYLKVLASINESQFVDSYRLSAGLLDSSWVSTASERADSYLNMRYFGREGDELRNLRDIANRLDPRVLMHELVHSATSRSLEGLIVGVRNGNIKKSSDAYKLLAKAEKVFEKAKSALKGTGLVDDYAFTDIHEFFAQTMNDPNLLKELSKISSVSKNTPKNMYTMLTDFVLTVAELVGVNISKLNLGTDTLHLIEMFTEINKSYVASSMNVIETFSQSFKGLTTKAPATTEVAAGKRLLDHVKEKMKQSFALYDNIAAGDEGLAKLLVSDATNTSAREPSVVDLKRNLELDMNYRAAIVDKAVEKTIRDRGVSWWDMFWNRKKYRETRAEVEEELTKYLQRAYDEERLGGTIPKPPPQIADAVNAYVKSGWAKRWRQHLIDHGLAKADDFPESDFYIPRQYSHARVTGFAKDDIIDLMSQSLVGRYASLPPDLVGRIANSWYTRIIRTSQRATGANWKELIHGMDENDIFFAMKESGIPEENIRKFISDNVPKSGATSKVKNLNHRAGFDMFKQVELKSGKFMCLADIMQTNTLGIMQSYTNRMSGRAAFAAKGITDMKTLVKKLDTIAEKGELPAEWYGVVDDTINHLLGMNVGGDIPEWIRAASNIGNSTMLKNSGIYQLTDLSIAVKEFGLGRVLKAMTRTQLFKGMDFAIKDKTLRGRLHNVLNNAYQNEARFRFLSTHADDNLDLANSSSVYMATHNISQGARLANGFSGVHRAMVNLMSGMVADAIDTVIKSADITFDEFGNIVAKNGTDIDLKVLREAGMTDSLLRQMRMQHSARPNQMFSPDVQRELEVVGTRVMDYMIQNIRTGETSHFAQFSTIGKVIVGYQSFALAATNKILRRHTAADNYTGLAILAAYQLPLMIMATKTKLAMDGRDESPQEVIKQAALNMSMIGGASLLSPMFTGEAPRHSLVSMAYIMQSMGAVRDLMSGESDLQSVSRVVPWAQEFVPTRMLINILAEDDED